MRTLIRYTALILILCFSVIINNYLYSQPFLLLDEGFQRDFSAKMKISIISEDESFDMLFSIIRRDNIICLSFNFDEFLDDSFELDNLVKFNINRNIILYNIDKNKLIYVFPDLQAYIVYEGNFEDISHISNTILKSTEGYEYKKEKMPDSEDIKNSDIHPIYHISISSEDREDNWKGYLIESSLMEDFPVQVELISEQQEIIKLADFFNISLETPKDIYELPRHYRKFNDLEQLLIYAIEK